MNSVADWYLFGEHNGAFRHFVAFQESLEHHAAAQKEYGDFIVQKADAFLKWSAWASPFDARDFNALFAHNLRELYTKKLPNNCVWGFKEIRYTATEALIFGQLFDTSHIVILQRKFEDFCWSWCTANFRQEELSVDLARQLVLLYLGFYQQLKIASAIAKKPFFWISYEEICASPLSFIDSIAAEFEWKITLQDQENVSLASRQVVDYVSDSVKASSRTLFSEFVKRATDLYAAGGGG
jgi:hypothetical protein